MAPRTGASRVARFVARLVVAVALVLAAAVVALFALVYLVGALAGEVMDSGTISDRNRILAALLAFGLAVVASGLTLGALRLFGVRPSFAAWKARARQAFDDD
jgi:hypothetical protein